MFNIYNSKVNITSGSSKEHRVSDAQVEEEEGGENSEDDRRLRNEEISEFCRRHPEFNNDETFPKQVDEYIRRERYSSIII